MKTRFHLNHTNRQRHLAYIRVLAGMMVVACWPLVSEGQERHEEVTIIAPYQPTISDAFKMNFTPEIRMTTEQEAREFEFNYLDRQLFAPLTLDPIQPQRYSQMSEEELLRNYIKAGFGNYTTPYIEFFGGSLRSEKFQFSAHLKHLSSQGKVDGYGPSGYSHNLVEVAGKYFTKQHTFSGNIDYLRDVYHFYGFEPDSFPSLEIDQDSLKQRFQNIGAGIVYSSNYKDAKKLAHSISLDFYNYSDKYGTHETNVDPKVILSKGFDLFRGFPPQVIGVELGLNYFSRKDTAASSSLVMINIRPWLDLDFEQYRIKGGFEIAAEKDSVTRTNFFPFISAEVVILPDQLKAFAELKAEKVVNSFRSLSTENPFITSTPEIRNSICKFALGGGITGNTSGFNYFAKAYYRFIQDMPLFVNDTSLVLLNRFIVIYDDVNEFSIEAGAGYELPKTLNVMLSGIYTAYDPQDELKAWHKPSYKLTLEGSYTFLVKYTVDAAIFLRGPFYYKTYSSGEAISGKSKAAADLNAGFKYQHNKYFSAFLKVNNILNKQYELWYRYPTQGIQVMAGLGFSF
jgi:hypothetical protein